MSSPRILILGAGSAGQRHARNLMTAGAVVEIADPVVDRANSVPGALPVAYDLNDMGGYDGIVVASPTSHHAQQALAGLAVSDRVLVEKPLATNFADAQRVARAGADRLMVGFNLRFHEPLERLVEVSRTAVGRILGVRLWFGSYLPDWHPGTDYRQGYSARSELGGGVLLDAIHELDLAVWIAGPGLKVEGAVVATVGRLEIDVEDTVKAVLKRQGGPVVDVSLDYLSRRYRRGVEVVGAEGTVRLDWARGVLEYEDSLRIDTQSAALGVDRSYEREAQCFLDWISGDAVPPVDGLSALESQRLADDVREFARTPDRAGQRDGR